MIEILYSVIYHFKRWKLSQFLFDFKATISYLIKILQEIYANNIYTCEDIGTLPNKRAFLKRRFKTCRLLFVKYDQYEWLL